MDYTVLYLEDGQLDQLHELFGAVSPGRRVLLDELSKLPEFLWEVSLLQQYYLQSETNLVSLRIWGYLGRVRSTSLSDDIRHLVDDMTPRTIRLYAGTGNGKAALAIICHSKGA